MWKRISLTEAKEVAQVYFRGHGTSLVVPTRKDWSFMDSLVIITNFIQLFTSSHVSHSKFYNLDAGKIY